MCNYSLINIQKSNILIYSINILVIHTLYYKSDDLSLTYYLNCFLLANMVVILIEQNKQSLVENHIKFWRVQYKNLKSAVSHNVPAYTGHGVVVEDAARKRELRLLKNR